EYQQHEPPDPVPTVLHPLPFRDCESGSILTPLQADVDGDQRRASHSAIDTATYSAIPRRQASAMPAQASGNWKIRVRSRIRTPSCSCVPPKYSPTTAPIIARTVATLRPEKMNGSAVGRSEEHTSELQSRG